MLGINKVEGYLTNMLPTPMRAGMSQANTLINSKQGQQIIDWGKTLVAQQIGGKKDSMLMNGIQVFSPKLYNAIRLTKGNLLHIPFALLFNERYLAYRLSKESGKGVNLIEALGIMFKPRLTSIIETGLLIHEGKIKLNPKALNPLN